MEDIVSGYDWTTIPRNSALREKAPHVILRSYKVKKNEALNRLKSYMNILESDPMEFYRKLYSDSTERGEDFRFPYFGDAVRSFNNEYGDTFQSGFMGNIDTILKDAAEEGGALFATSKIGMGNILDTYSKISNATGSQTSAQEVQRNFSDITKNITSAPGSYIETPKIYQYMNNDSPLTIELVLSNTINEDSIEKNSALVEKLITINRPTRLNSVEMEPPYIYNIKIPGLRYMEWAFCNSMDVKLLGSRRIINDKIIPDGYYINLSFASLTTEVSNFMKFI